jgi:hypothetical protein
MEPRVDPAEEARHMEAMRDLGVYGAAWAHAKVLTTSDLDRNQSRLLLVAEDLVQGGPIAELFPELGHDDDGDNAQHNVPVMLLSADGVEKAARICYHPAMGRHRIIGSGWNQFVRESGIPRGDRIDVYTCSRANGERCLFFFFKS